MDMTLRVSERVAWRVRQRWESLKPRNHRKGEMTGCDCKRQLENKLFQHIGLEYGSSNFRICLGTLHRYVYASVSFL